MKSNIFFILLLASVLSFSQSNDKEKISNSLTYKANKEYNSKNYSQAEANYRNAISKNEQNVIAQYNMAGSLYKQHASEEALAYLSEASISKNAKPEQKHLAFHNLGNLYMQKKDYQQAVQCYQQALRNNPTDEQTRYNLALAKKFLKQNPPKPQQNKKNQDKKDNKDQNQQDKQDNKKQQDNQNNNNQQNKQDNNNQNDKNNQNKKQDNNQDKKQNNKNNGQNPDQNSNPQNNNNQQNSQNPQGGDKPQKGNISPQQAQRILQAIDDQESKTQQKINAKKVKGRPEPNQKDW